MNERIDAAEIKKKGPEADASKAEEPWHNSVSMTHPAFNKMVYDPNQRAETIPGPKLNELHVNPAVDNDVHYQKIAKDGADFIAINGNINIAVKHALADAYQNDKLSGGGHNSVDKLLSFMNKELHGTYFSMTRDGDKVMLLDSRDNEHLKHDASGKALLHAREKWNLKTQKYER